MDLARRKPRVTVVRIAAEMVAAILVVDVDEERTVGAIEGPGGMGGAWRFFELSPWQPASGFPLSVVGGYLVEAFDHDHIRWNILRLVQSETELFLNSSEDVGETGWVTLDGRGTRLRSRGQRGASGAIVLQDKGIFFFGQARLIRYAGFGRAVWFQILPLGTPDQKIEACREAGHRIFLKFPALVTG